MTIDSQPRSIRHRDSGYLPSPVSGFFGVCVSHNKHYVKLEIPASNCVTSLNISDKFDSQSKLGIKSGLKIGWANNVGGHKKNTGDYEPCRGGTGRAPGGVCVCDQISPPGPPCANTGAGGANFVTHLAEKSNTIVGSFSSAYHSIDITGTGGKTNFREPRRVGRQQQYIFSLHRRKSGSTPAAPLVRPSKDRSSLHGGNQHYISLSTDPSCGPWRAGHEEDK